VNYLEPRGGRVHSVASMEAPVVRVRHASARADTDGRARPLTRAGEAPALQVRGGARGLGHAVAAGRRECKSTGGRGRTERTGRGQCTEAARGARSRAGGTACFGEGRPRDAWRPYVRRESGASETVRIGNKRTTFFSQSPLLRCRRADPSPLPSMSPPSQARQLREKAALLTSVSTVPPSFSLLT